MNQKILEFMEQLQKNYFEHFDVDLIYSYFDDDSIMVAAGHNQIFSGKYSILRFLKSQIHMDNVFTVESMEHDISPISNGFWRVLSTVHLLRNADSQKFNVIMSLICVTRGGNISISAVHSSISLPHISTNSISSMTDSAAGAEVEKGNNIMLQDQLSRDAVTGLYNQKTFDTIVTRMLQRYNGSSGGSLLVLTIENFHNISDAMGPRYCNHLLTDVAELLKNFFISVDVIGRTGISQFSIYVSRLASPTKLKERGLELFDELADLPSARAASVPFSLNLGISIFPRDGMNYTELLKSVEVAVNYARTRGKNQICIYDDDLLHSFKPMKFTVSNFSQGQQSSLNGYIVDNAFNTLYRAADLDSAINSLLTIIGRHFNLDRVCVFEALYSDDRLSNTFEWCGVGVVPRLKTLQAVSAIDINGYDYRDNFDKDGLFYCADTQALRSGRLNRYIAPEARALLQYSMWHGGVFRGFLGFESSSEPRFWSNEHISTISFISDILATFLIEKRNHEGIARSARSMRTVLDNQAIAVYVIDETNYRIIYYNKRTRELFPQVAADTLCHKVMFNRSIPCTNCPVTRASIHKSCRTQLTTLDGKHLFVDAKAIKWGLRNVVLLSAYDLKNIDNTEK